jgi:hypothetical protein
MDRAVVDSDACLLPAILSDTFGALYCVICVVYFKLYAMSTRSGTPEDLDRLLSECSERLVDCASAIRDLPLANYRENIHRVGKAMAAISEVCSELYKAYPALKPELWDAAPSDEHYGAWFDEAQRMANEYCAAGLPLRAVETYESYLFIGPSQKYETLAKQALSDLKAKHGV